MVELNTKIGKYKVVEELHRGSHTVVCRALHEPSGNSFIIKLHESATPTAREMSKLQREYEVGSLIEHEHTINYVDLFEWEQRLVLVTEDTNAVSIKDLRKQGDFEIGRFLNIAIQLSDSLHHIHSQNVVHKDIKPKNIIINPEDDYVKIIDFGISAILSDTEQLHQTAEQLEGTMHYISPEQTGRMNRKVDHRTDFYSLGVTFYEVLTGSYPFKNKDELELIHCHIARMPEPPHERNIYIPKAISDIVMKLLAKNPEDRYQTAWGLKKDLEECKRQWDESKEITPFTPGKDDQNSRFQIPQKLYGRKSEIDLLHSAYGKILDGNTRILTIDGHAGVGKSVLIQEIRKPLQQEQGYFISGKFDQLQKNIPYIAFIRAFSEVVKQFLTLNEADIERFKLRLREALGPNLRLITDVIPELTYLVGEQPPIEELPPAESQNRFNLTFQRFIECFMDDEKPLILVLDDVQWIDSASLQLLRTLTVDGDLGRLLIILAYRDEEIDAGHPFNHYLEDLSKAGLKPGHIHLTPLNRDHLLQMINDTINTSGEEATELANLVHSKTNGNPFFVNEFLKTLHNRDLIRFDQEALAWKWDSDKIEKQGITDNVIDLMTDRINQLHTESARLLQLASCVGNEFDSRTLATVLDADLPEIEQTLTDPIRKGLIIDYSENETEDTHWYRFLHDRVQEAAYSTLNDAEREKYHYTIGKLLLRSTDNDEDINELLFDITNHLNTGKRLLKTEEERIRLIELNLQAGTKAKQANAYEAAEQYFLNGIKLCAPADWKEHYQLVFSLYSEGAESRYLNLNFEEAEELFKTALKNANNRLDRASVYKTRVVLYMNLNKYEEVTQFGIEGARELGINLPVKTAKLALLPELAKARMAFRNRTIEDIYDLPELDDPELKLLLEILENTTPGAYFANQDMMALMVLKMVNISIKKGVSPSSPFALATFGMMLGSIFGVYDKGHRFGEIAVKLSDRFEQASTRAKAYHLFANFINHWTQPTHTNFSIIKDSLTYARESGDFVYVGYNHVIDIGCAFLLGYKLDRVHEKIDGYLDVAGKIKMADSEHFAYMMREVVKRFADPETDYTNLDSNTFSTQVYFEFVATQANKITEFIYYLLGIQRGLMFDDIALASRFVDRAKELKDAPLGTVYMSEYQFWIGIYGAQVVQKRTIKQSLRKYKKWSSINPENNHHKYLFLQAEYARMKGRTNQSLSFYDQAIEEASQEGYNHLKAFAAERAGRYLTKLNRSVPAQFYIGMAYEIYGSWGARAKQQVLKQEFSFLHHRSQRTASDDSSDSSSSTSSSYLSNQYSSSDTTQSIDLATVIKASQSISGEIELNSLLKRMMQLVLENAGAEYGALFVWHEGSLYLKAEGSSNGESTLLDAVPYQESSHLCTSVVQYVIRTQDDVVLNDARNDGLFTDDSYINEKGIKSILCSPVTYQGKMKAVIYLENNLTTGAFTSQRLRVLNLLSSQLAVSMENAGLYDNMKSLNEELKAEIIERKRSEEARIAAITESKRKSQELKNARAFQHSMLPESPPDHQNLDIAVFLKTATEVGGDYYDFFEDKNGDLFAIVGDATGHGLSAGMMVGMTKSALHSIDSKIPADILKRLNYTIKNANPGRLKMALNIARFQGDTVTLSSAAMPPLYHYKKADHIVDEILIPGMPLGTMMSADFMEEQIMMKPGDLLISMSDGLPERANPDGTQMGYDVIEEHILAHADVSAQEMLDSLIELGEDFADGVSNDDDITLMVVRKKSH